MKQKRQVVRWCESNMEIMLLICVGYLGSSAYGAALRRILAQVNRRAWNVPSVYGYLHRAAREGWVITAEDREGNRSVLRYTLTTTGKEYLRDRLDELSGVNAFSKTNAGYKDLRKRVGISS